MMISSACAYFITQSLLDSHWQHSRRIRRSFCFPTAQILDDNTTLQDKPIAASHTMGAALSALPPRQPAAVGRHDEPDTTKAVYHPLHGTEYRLFVIPSFGLYGLSKSQRGIGMISFNYQKLLCAAIIQRQHPVTSQ